MSYIVRWARSIVGVLWLFLSACNILGPTTTDFVNQRPMDPPAYYAGYYAEVEVCLGMAGDYGAIEWFVADEINHDGVEMAGIIHFPNRVTIREGQVHSTVTSKYEMIHHVLQKGDEIHDTGVFARCAVPVI